MCWRLQIGFLERERERERKRNGEESDIVILEFLFLSLTKEYFEFIGFQYYNTFKLQYEERKNEIIRLPMT